MKQNILFLLICLLINQFVLTLQSVYKRVCVYPNWSVLRPSKLARMFPEDINPKLCTHIHYAYANINVRTLDLMPSLRQDVLNGEHGDPLYERIMKLRQMNSNLKILISVGGYFAKSTSFDQVVSSELKRKKFVENVLKFLQKWKFDGMDVQWEYPGDGAAPDSRERFTHLLQSLSNAFKSEGFLLTTIGPSDEIQIDSGYQVKEICQLVDYISVETYDYSGFQRFTAYNSPLYSRLQSQESVNKTVNYWLDKGCPRKKILVGISTYARAFKVLNKQPNTMIYFGTEAEPVLSTSNYTLEEGTLSYFEICELMQVHEAKTYWDHRTFSSFAIVKGKEPKTAKNDLKSVPYSLWITYEDGRSARKKAEFIKNNTLGGATFWTIDMDDFKGIFCKIEPFPIIESVKEELEANYFSYNKATNTYTNKLILGQASSTIKPKTILTSTVIRTKFNSVNTSQMISSKLTEKKMNTFSLPTIATNSKKNGFNFFIQANNSNYKIIRAIKLTGCVDSEKCFFKSNSNRIRFNLANFLVIFVFFNLNKKN